MIYSLTNIFEQNSYFVLNKKNTISANLNDGLGVDLIVSQIISPIVGAITSLSVNPNLENPLPGKLNWMAINWYILRKYFGGYYYIFLFVGHFFGFLVKSGWGFKARMELALICFITCMPWISQIYFIHVVQHLLTALQHRGLAVWPSSCTCVQHWWDSNLRLHSRLLPRSDPKWGQVLCEPRQI